MGSDGVREKDGVKLSFLYQTSTNSVRQGTQALVKDMWSQIGVSVELRNISANVFFAGVLFLTMVTWNVLIIPREEAHLAARFGQPYDEYRAATARILPGL